MKNFAKPFRLGRKKKRAILDANGLEVCIFPTGCEDEAQIVCNLYNGDYGYYDELSNRAMQESKEDDEIIVGEILLKQYHITGELSTETLQEAAEKEYPLSPLFGNKNNELRKAFINGATHQAPITKAETIEDVVRVIENNIKISDNSNGRLSDSAAGWNNALTNLLSQIKNI